MEAGEGGYSNWKAGLSLGGGIPHYYGDYVRQLFMAMAVLSLVVIPLWGDMLPFGTFAQVGAALALVILASFTTPTGLYILITDATFSAVSVFLLESYAIRLRSSQSLSLFLAREAGALLMLAALYFSIKTIRAIASGKLGHADSPLEFEDPLI